MYVKNNPEVAPFVNEHASKGLSEHIDNLKEQMVDMEVVAVTLAHKKYKGHDNLILDKLTKWKDHTSINWEWLINKLSVNNTDKTKEK